MFFSHNSEPCGNFWTILRHKLPIIHPDLPITSNNLNSKVQPELLNPNLFYNTEKSSRVLTAERNVLLVYWLIGLSCFLASMGPSFSAPLRV